MKLRFRCTSLSAQIMTVTEKEKQVERVGYTADLMLAKSETNAQHFVGSPNSSLRITTSKFKFEVGKEYDVELTKIGT